VEPGDWLRGDADGLVALPEARIDILLETAERVHAAEDAIRKAVESGISLREARAAAGYHKLQSRR
jgi:regulator of RNase E activity RraA